MDQLFCLFAMTLALLPVVWSDVMRKRPNPEEASDEEVFKYDIGM